MKLLVKFVAIFLLLSMIISLSSCSSGSNSIASESVVGINKDSARIKEASYDNILYKTESPILSYEEVFEYINSETSLLDFCDHFGLNHYKIIRFSSSILKEMNPTYDVPWFYIIINTDKCPVMFIFANRYDFTASDNVDNNIFTQCMCSDHIDISFSKDETEEKIKTIRLLETIEEDVQKIDPDGCYFINENEYLGPEMYHESYHFFENGNAYIIVYRDSHNEVEDVVLFTM